MQSLDWILFAAYLVGVFALGVAAARGSRTSRGYFVADRAMPWWAVGLSVMATQASAITIIGTTGHAYAEGMRFAQFYLGLPVALAILCFTLVPLYRRADVNTAYELLGRRFDGKTRLATALCFLALRSVSLGVVVYAPSLVLSLVLGWSLPATILVMTSIAVLYTTAGGLRAVIWTDVVQMLLVLGGLGACVLLLAQKLPEGWSVRDALALASESGRTRLVDLSFDPADRYTVWSGLLGGTLLFLAYFGCDQSQVQRLLAARSLAHVRLALAFNAVFKIPVQLAVLAVGVLLFAALHFERAPLFFDPHVRTELAADAATSGALEALEERHAGRADERREAALRLHAARGTDGEDGARAGYRAALAGVEEVRGEALALAARGGRAYDDTNSIFPWFLLDGLPLGLAGLLLAVIFAAAMSSIDSEVSALAATTINDLYRPYLVRDAADGHYVLAARLATLGWGAVAAGFALFAGRLGSVIEAVNAVGSYFYGALLGTFALAYGARRANGDGAVAGLAAGVLAVAVCDARLDVAWLWLNPIGAATTVAVGLAVSRLRPRPAA